MSVGAKATSLLDGVLSFEQTKRQLRAHIPDVVRLVASHERLRDALRDANEWRDRLADRIIALESEREADRRMLEEWKANAPHPGALAEAESRLLDAQLERDAYAARWREVTKACDAALAKAETYERDWYAAKSEFGDAMAKMRERVRALEAAIDSAYADLCDAYQHWNADRDSKVGKIIGDVARALKAAKGGGQ